ncbi:MAG: PorT family protein [Cyclobacteriaceae bacterium]|nr:PorT family protein [Cyclobacteriaceae bacterium]
MNVRNDVFLLRKFNGNIMVKLTPLFLTALLSILFKSNAEAQILVGPVVGTHVGWASYDDRDLKDFYDVSPTFGFHAGGSVAFRVQKRFFLQTSILYTQKEKKISGGDDGMFSNSLRNRYIDMPILYTAEFKARLGKDKIYKWYLGVGPNVSYWLGGKGTLANSSLDENLIDELKYKVTFGKQTEVGEQEMNVEDPNRVQLGLNISAGLIFEPMGIHKFMLTTRYEHGHSFLSRSSMGVFGEINAQYQDELKVRNNAFVVSLYYFIDLKIEERHKGKSTSKIKTGKKKR